MSVRRGRLAVVPAALILIAGGGCGDDDDGAGGDGGSGEGVQLDAPISLADCTDWKEGSVEERLGTIAQIRDFTGAPIAGTSESGTTLSDERAYDLFENYCENEFARGFKLYKLYGRAAAFSGRIPEQ